MSCCLPHGACAVVHGVAHVDGVRQHAHHLRIPGSLGCISHCRRDCRIQGSGRASTVKCTVDLLGRGGLGRSFRGTERDGAVRTVVRVWWRNFGRIQRMLSVLQTTAMRSARCVQRSRFLCSGDAGASREHRSSPGPESSNLAPGTTARALRPAASSSSKTPPRRDPILTDIRAHAHESRGDS